MKMNMDKSKGQHCGFFLGGLLFGTAGLKILAGSSAKDAYVKIVAAGLRAKDSILTTATKVQENAEDVLAAAEELNEERKETALEVDETPEA